MLYILIKSVINKVKNHYYHKIAEKYTQIFVHSIIMVKFGDTKIAKEKFYASKKKT